MENDVPVGGIQFDIDATFGDFAVSASLNHGQSRSLSTVVKSAYHINEARIGRKMTGWTRSFSYCEVLSIPRVLYIFVVFELLAVVYISHNIMHSQVFFTYLSF